MTTTSNAFMAFWREFRKDRLGMFGFSLLVAFCLAALVGPLIIPFSDASEKWQDITYWQDNPESAPPEWTNWFAAQKSTSTWRSASVKPNTEEQDGVVKGTAEVVYEWKADLPPRDVIVLWEGRGQIVYRLMVTRPDGQEILLSQNNIDMSSGGVNRESVGSNSSDQMLEWVRTVVGESAGYSIDPYQFSPIDYLFAQANETMAEERTALTGPYRFRLEYMALDGAQIDSLRLAVPGSVSGLLGTDKSKRDLFSGVIVGIRWALLIGILTSLLNVLMGVTLAIVSGYLGGWVDSVIQRITEFFLQLPVLPFIIVISAIFKPSIWFLIGIFCLFFWVGPVKPVRSMTLQIREETFVEASRALGASRLRIILRHIFPILLPFSFASIALSVPGIIVYEASLSLLGLGDATIVTWGQILNGAFSSQAFLSNMWWWVIPPGLAMALMGMTFAFLGFSLDKILHPKLKTR